jgi:glutamate synthase (NADPH/NADH) small chain
MLEDVTRAARAIDRKQRVRTNSRGTITRSPEERIHDFEDVVVPLTAELAMSEAGRCVQCPDPAPCMLACPAHNNIPEAMWLIEQGRFLEAAELYRQTTSLPEICGRVCPQEQLCQGSCPHKKVNEAVMTGALEAFVADFQRREVGVEIPRGASTGKKVAIIGAGPAGLSWAEQLVQYGHQVAIYDSKPTAAGCDLQYPLNLPKDVAGVGTWNEPRLGFISIPTERYQDRRPGHDGWGDLRVIRTLVGTLMDVPGEDLPGL